MAKSYQMLYKCRLCGQVFVNYGTVSEKVAEQSTARMGNRGRGGQGRWLRKDRSTQLLSTNKLRPR